MLDVDHLALIGLICPEVEGEHPGEGGLVHAERRGLLRVERTESWRCEVRSSAGQKTDQFSRGGNMDEVEEKRFVVAT